METLETIGRWIVLLSALYGLYYLAVEKITIKREFAPLFVCSNIAVFVFAAGIFGGLLPAVYITVIVGCICFLWRLNDYFKKRVSIQWGGLFHVVFFLGSSCFLLQLLRTELVHYDNFTHWALVVKEMLITKSFPHADSVLIEFKNYPLGMSSFLYFVCEVLGYQAPHMIFAQGIVIVSCFYALFGIIAEKKRFLLYAFLAAGCSVLSVFTLASRINNLLVDVAVPLLALAAIAVIYWYRKEINKACLVSCPVLAFLVIVKNTGIVFAVFVMLYFLYIVLHYCKIGTEKIVYQSQSFTIYSVDGAIILLLKTVGTLLLAMSTFLLWQYHVATEFAGIENKFDMPAIVAQGLPFGKTPEDMHRIVNLFLQSIVNITLRSTIGILVFEVVAIVGCVIGVAIVRKKWILPKVFLCLNIILIVYYIGILSLYIFSMPLDEALRLAGFERYACSIVVFLLGALLMCLTIDIERSFHYAIGEVEDYRAFQSIDTKNMYNNSVIACITVTLLFLTSEYNGLQQQNSNYGTSLPAQVKAVVGDCWQENVNDAKYLFYASDAEEQITSYYLQHVTKYYLRTTQVDAICCFYEDNLQNLLSQYDVLVVMESDMEAQALLEKYLGISGEVGVYDLHNLEMMKVEN